MKWHLRFGHYKLQILKLMKTKEMVNGKNNFIPTLPFCKSCLYGKQQQKSYLPMVEKQFKTFWNTSIWMYEN